MAVKKGGIHSRLYRSGKGNAGLGKALLHRALGLPWRMTKLLLPISLGVIMVCSCDEGSKPDVETGAEKKPAAEAHMSISTKPADERISSEAVQDTSKATEEKIARQQAAAIVRALVNAVENFEMDFDYLPLPASAVKLADCNTDTSEFEQLITILTGMSQEQNSRRKHYLGDVPQAKVENGKAFGGLHRESGEEPALYDPWGKFFKISLDLDGDRNVLNPNPEPSSGEPAWFKASAIAWSAGPDGDPDTWDDNICSWR